MQEVEITGSPISWIQRQLLSGDILSDDMFLVSTPELTSVSIDRTYEFNDEKYTTRYASEYVTYEQLSSQIFKDIYGYLGLCSMASADYDDYALLNHIHNYSKVSSRTDTAPEYYSRFDTADLCDIMTFTIDGWSKHFYSVPVIEYKQANPVIGQLRFMALNSLSEKPNTAAFYGSSTFDGWVYPDGRTLNQTDFPDAYSFFGTSYGTDGDGTFKIPLLNNFIKIKSAINDTTSYINPVDEKKVLKRHNHGSGALNTSGTINYTLNFENTKNFDKYKLYNFNSQTEEYELPDTSDKYTERKKTVLGDVAHGIVNNSSTNEQNAYLSVEVKIDYTSSVNAIAGQVSADLETYPNHKLLPVFIYIGKYMGNAL